MFEWVDDDSTCGRFRTTSEFVPVYGYRIHKLQKRIPPRPDSDNPQSEPDWDGQAGWETIFEDKKRSVCRKHAEQLVKKGFTVIFDEKEFSWFKIYSFHIKGRQLPQYHVYNSVARILIGVIKYYPQWRQFVLFPEPKTIWSKGCLEEVNTFIYQVEKERKE